LKKPGDELPMNPLFVELQWLPRPPEQFAERLRALGNSAGPPGHEPLGRELQRNASRIARTRAHIVL
jgi:hypothetical protein